MDRRRHQRYAANGSAEVLVLHDVDIESSCSTVLTVLSSAPAASGSEAMVRLMAPGRRQVTLRVRASHSHPVFVGGRRRYRVIYSVLGETGQASS